MGVISKVGDKGERFLGEAVCHWRSGCTVVGGCHGHQDSCDILCMRGLRMVKFLVLSVSMTGVVRSSDTVISIVQTGQVQG